MSTATVETKVKKSLIDKNVKAFLKTIRKVYGTLDQSGYNTTYTTTGLGEPLTVFEFNIDSIFGIAGAYYISKGEWFSAKNEYKLKDFSPDNQDFAIGAILEVQAKSLDNILHC